MGGVVAQGAFADLFQRLLAEDVLCLAGVLGGGLLVHAQLLTHFYVQLGVDEQTAAAMKALAKSKLEKALQDSGYAQGGYAAEMEQAALMAEAKETMER